MVDCDYIWFLVVIVIVAAAVCDRFCFWYINLLRIAVIYDDENIEDDDDYFDRFCLWLWLWLWLNVHITIFLIDFV